MKCKNCGKELQVNTSTTTGYSHVDEKYITGLLYCQHTYAIGEPIPSHISSITKATLENGIEIVLDEM